MKNTLLSTSLFFILIITACSSRNDEQKMSESKYVSPKVELTFDTAVTNFYTILSGTEKDTDTTGNNSAEKNNLWKKMDDNLLSKLREWKKTNLPADCQQTSFLFYPFSGPDFIIPNTLFEKANHLVMFGLEETGKDISHNGIDFAKAIKPKMQKSLRDYVGKSYFITKNMMSDLDDDTLNGVVPLLSTFIVKEGFVIHTIKNFQLSASGQKTFPATPQNNDSIVNGVEIVYYKQGDTSYRKIDYLSFNATDESLKKTTGVLPFMKSTIPADCIGYFKSASYLMHYNAFSSIRDLALEKCRYILQDDTGIPVLSYLNNWTLTLWGKYTKPIRDFSGVFQPELDSLYKVKVVKPLPFNMGYHYFDGKQNLLLAQKIK